MPGKRIGVVGLGLLGRGIAGSLLSHGFEVITFERSQEVIEQTRLTLRDALQELREHGFENVPDIDVAMSRYTEATSLGSFSNCDFVIESIVESAQAKEELFDELEAIVGDDVPIASNTSALPITLLQKSRKRAARFLGMHWAEPAHATRFLELIRGEQTNDSSMEAAIALARALGKEPCVVQRDIPGFIANRLGYAMYREACHLLELGVGDAETIDTCFRNSVGLWASVCGPFRWIDLTGGPELYARAMGGVLPSLSAATAVPEPLATMMAEGAAGVRNGKGFYSYTPEQAYKWEQIYREQVWRVREVVDATFPISNEAG